MRRARSGKGRNRKDFSDASIMLVFLVFVVLVIFFFDESRVLQSAGEAEAVPSLEKDREMLISKLVIDHERQDGPAIIVGNVVNTVMLNKVANTNYEQLKRLFGVEAEFVIYFEDEQGNILAVGEKPCIGSHYAYVNGRRCSE